MVQDFACDYLSCRQFGWAGAAGLFYAALATLAVLLSQIYGVATEGFDPATIFHAE